MNKPIVKLVRCNKAYKPKCPDRQRKKDCPARKPHHPGNSCSLPFMCFEGGEFQCKCVKYVRPKATVK